MTTTVERATAVPLQLAPRHVDRVYALDEPRPTSQSDQQRFMIPGGDPIATDPFVLASEDWFSTVGFDWHPHRGFETVTYVVDGELEHKDSTGGYGVLRAGDVQWTTMGHAVMHAELAYKRRNVHTLQLWLNSPAALKTVEPGYQNLASATVPAIEQRGAQVRVYSGRVQGVQGPAVNIWPATVIDARMDAGSRFVHEVPGEHAAFLYVLKGEVAVGRDEVAVGAGQVAWFACVEPGATAIALAAREHSLVVAYSAAPIREPVVAYGPFVMTTMEEIRQAFADYRAGLFGPMPTW